MNTTVKILPLLLIAYFMTSANAVLTTDASEYDYVDEYDNTNRTKSSMETTTSTSRTTDEYYSDEEEYSEDYEEDDVGNEKSEVKKQPYNCPVQCKCQFRSNSVEEATGYDDEDTYDYERESVKVKRVKKRRRRSVDLDSKNASKTNENDYNFANDYNDRRESKSEGETKATKYDIKVDCSGQGLQTIADLFDYDFPMDQIISFNLSNNKFRLMRLDDGFEDLINLRELDISSNLYLKGISPRNFLKKFRFLEKIHLNNLPQINCQQNEKSNRIVTIDCKWYRTLLYLHKRNITIDFQQNMSRTSQRCSLASLINNRSNNIALISRCLTDFESPETYPTENLGPLSNPEKRQNQTRVYVIDNVQYEFKIEPDISQLLIEGDSLELTCRLTRRALHATNGKKNSPFHSQIKWYLNDNQQLVISSIFYNGENPTQIQIIESRLKRHKSDEDIVESKLMVTNTLGAQHTGKYFCSAIIDSSWDSSKRTPITTNKVDIKVINRKQLDGFDKNGKIINKLDKKDDTKTLYCGEIITQTYKGVYKWPKTIANSKLSQKCAFGKRGNASDNVMIECRKDGKWADYIEVDNCLFESNLTRYLHKLLEKIEEPQINDLDRSALLSLDEFIHKIVSIQSEKSDSPVSSQITTYDINYIQKFLSMTLSANRSVLLASSSWKHQFLWLSDMLARLSDFYLRRAQTTDPSLYSKFFFDSLMSVVDSDQELSTHLAYLKVRNPMIMSCRMTKMQLTQQYVFKCGNKIATNETLPKYTQINIVEKEKKQNLINYQKVSNPTEIEFIVFENDKLLPININSSNSNYDVLSLVDISKSSSMESTKVLKNRTCSQIVAFRSKNETQFDLSLEIFLPPSYYRLLNLMQVQLANATLDIQSTKVRNENECNLFDWIFQLKSDDVDASKSGQSTMVISNGDLATEIPGSENADESKIQWDEKFTKSEKRMRTFQSDLLNKWLNSNSYEIVYSMFGNFNSTKDNRSYEMIEWQTKRLTSLGCDIDDLKINWNQNLSIPSNELYRVYANIKCKSSSQNQTSSFVYIGLRHKSNEIKPSNVSSQNQIGQLFAQYASIFKHNLDDEKTLFESILQSLKLNYHPFEQRKIYFASILSSILLLVNICLYTCFHGRLLMPRSFYHVLINKWLAVLFICLIYTLGSMQIDLPHLCLLTAFLTQYFLLASFIWYALYFYALNSKLSLLKKRNANLIFNSNDNTNKFNGGIFSPKSNDYNGLDEANLGFIKRPVLHYYMLGWGLPMLLCLIIISITKRDYVQTPFSYCFTNEPNIVIGSILVPIVLIFLVQFVLVMAIWRNLRKIVGDLKKDEIINAEIEDDEREEAKTPVVGDKVDDREELCKNWINSKKDLQNFNKTAVDNLASTDMIEIKMNPITQKSLVINRSAYTGSTSSFERESSMDSDRTSVMDTQYKPHIQLKFAVLSWLIYFILCSIAISLTLVSTTFQPDLFLQKLFSILFAVLILLYSGLQLSFYVLSRDDVLMLNLGHCWGVKETRKIEPEFLQEIENKETDENGQMIEADNWYFEPKMIVPVCDIREEKKLAMSPPKISLDDCIYEKYQFKSAIEKEKVQKQTETEIGENLITTTQSTDQKITQNNCGNTSAEISDTENDPGMDSSNDHKKSISDAIFSAKKSSPIPPPIAERLIISNNQSLSPNNLIDDDENSTSSPILSTSHDSHSYSDSNVNNLIDPQYQLDNDESKTEESQMPLTQSICPTLAVQEDVSDYITMTPQVEQTTKLAISTGKKATHVRNPSLLSGSTAQTIQLITGGGNFSETENRTRKQTMNNQTSKRPLYVYVDYSYEEQILQKIRTPPPAGPPPQLPPKHEEQPVIKSRDSPNPRKNLDDLLSNTCSSHMGNPIDSFVPNSELISNSMSILNGAKSSLSNTTQSLNSSSTSSNNTNIKSKLHSKSNGCVSSNTTTRTSSMVSSNESNGFVISQNLMTVEQTMVEATLEESPKYTSYLQSNAIRTAVNKSEATNITKIMPPSVATRVSVNGKLISTSNNGFAKTSIIRPRLKEFEIKHETSV